MRECDTKNPSETPCFYRKDNQCSLAGLTCIDYYQIKYYPRLAKLVQFFVENKDSKMLLGLIEGDISAELRKLSLGALNLIEKDTKEYFKLLENIAISDENSEMRGIALDIIFNRFPDKAQDIFYAIWDGLRRIDEDDEHFNYTVFKLNFFVQNLTSKASLDFFSEFINENIEFSNGNGELLKFYIRNKNKLSKRPFRFEYDFGYHSLMMLYHTKAISKQMDEVNFSIYFHKINDMDKDASKPFDLKELYKKEELNDGDWYYIVAQRRKKGEFLVDYYYKGFSFIIFEFIKDFFEDKNKLIFRLNKKNDKILITTEEMPKLYIEVELHGFNRSEPHYRVCYDKIRIIEKKYLKANERYKKKLKINDLLDFLLTKPYKDEPFYWIMIFERKLKSGSYFHYVDIELLLFVLSKIELGKHSATEFNLKSNLDYLIVNEPSMDYFFKIKVAKENISFVDKYGGSLRSFYKEIGKINYTFSDYLLGHREIMRLSIFDEGYTTRRDLNIKEEEELETEFIKKNYDKIANQVIKLYKEFYLSSKEETRESTLTCVIDEIICDNYLEKDLMNNRTAWNIRESLIKESCKLLTKIYQES